MLNNDEITRTNFNVCLKNSHLIPEENWDGIFHKCFGDDCKIAWKNDKVSQLDFGSDVLVTTKKGRKFSIDVKTRNIRYLAYPDWLLEISHHIYSNDTMKHKISTVSGWLYKSTSDIIFFATIDGNNEILEVCAFSLYPFKNKEFAPKLNNFFNAWASTDFDNGIYQLTLNKKIPIEILKGTANFFWYWEKKADNDDQDNQM